jgi:hypothetical protein
MKRFTSKFLLMLTMILMLASISSAPAQVMPKTLSAPSVNTPLLVYHFSIDSLSSDSSAAFSLAPYDAESFYTYPLSYAKQLSSAGTPKVTLLLQGYYGFGTWGTIDTIFTADSVTTLSFGTIDLNNKHCPWYRLKGNGTTGNRRDTKLDFGIYASKRPY